MAIAVHSSSSTTYASRTNTVVTAPASISDGDILVCTMVVAANGTGLPVAPTAPAGWTIFGTNTSVSDGGGFNGKLFIWWKRAASESGNYTFTHVTDSTQAFLAAYSGCIASGTPLGATANNSLGGGNGASNQTSIGLGITTTAANSWLLYFEHCWGDSAQSNPSSPTMTTDFNGVIVFASHLLFASAGATGNVTQANGNNVNNPWATRMVELLAATAGGGTSTGTLGVTLGTATAAATGKVLVQGTLGATLGALTLAGSGTVSSLVATGTLSATLGVLTAAATGKVLVRGTAGITLAPLTLFGAGTNRPIVTGTFAVALDALNLDGSGTVANRANPWKLELRDFTAWSVETTGATKRITDDLGYRRITEQGNIRIIESKPFSWKSEPNSHNPWTQE